MLRPATPLAVIFLAAFVMLLLSTLSTPVIKAIPLASFKGTNFGVFGYCEPNNKCSPIGIGYSYEGLTEDNSAHNFSLPTSARHSLSSILVVHPVAALLTLICFGLSVAAHFHSPAHSPRYLLALLIFTIPTVLVSLLAFLVDILIFVPHVSWGGWIVLAATILIIASMVLTCAMRRTLVSRKARKKRIAENAEMSGENYYHQRAAVDMNMVNTPLGPPSTIGTMSEFPKAESPPPMPTISPNSETAGDFASFDIEKKMSGDERMPLSGNGAAPGRGRSSSGGWRGPGMGPMNDPYGPPMGRSRDPYGPGAPPNPAMGPGMGMMAAGMGAGLRRQSSDNSMGSRGSSTRGGPPPFYGRGRGGYPQRGGYPPRGAPYGRGSMRGGPMGYGGPGRGGPMGYGGPGRGGPMMGRGGMRGPPPPNYYGGPPSNPPGPRGPYDGSTYVGSQQQDVSPPGSREQNLDAPPGAIGQAVEMDGRNGVPSPTRQNFGLRDSDADVQGMIGMQQQRRSDATDPMSPTSVYSEQPFVPARAAWRQPGPPPDTASSDPSASTASAIRTPHTNSSSQTAGRALSPIAHSPVEKAHDSGSYYEDPDPTFAAQSNSPPPQGAVIPSALMAGVNPSPGAIGRGQLQTPAPGEFLAPQTAILERDSSSSSLAEGARSPAESETSHYTSVSQRGINPNWQGPGPGPGEGRGLPSQMMGPQHMRRPSRPQAEDAVLGMNPDFQIPGVGMGGMPGRGGMRGGGGFRGRGGSGMGIPRGGGPYGYPGAI